MSKYVLLCASLAGLMCAPVATGSVAAPRQAAQRACIAEARQSVTQSVAYRNGSARTRVALTNAYTPGVTAALKTCRTTG